MKTKLIYFILISIFLLVFTPLRSEAQVYKLNAYEAAIRVQNSDGTWQEWSDWMKTDGIPILIDCDNGKISIFSSDTQYYDLLNKDDEYTDVYGARCYDYKVSDKHHKRCIFRMRKQRDGQLQIYIKYSDVMWAYNVVAVD